MTLKRTDNLNKPLGEKDVLSRNTLKTNAKRNQNVSEEANETENYKETPRSNM